MAGTYTVVKGDNLSKIAAKYNTTWQKLVEWNKDRYPSLSSNPNLIYAGQVLKVSSTGTAPAKPKTSNKKAKIDAFELLAGEDKTLIATWGWNRKNVDKYKVYWKYMTQNGIWMVGSDTTTTYKYSTYTVPSNATKVGFKVKPVSKKNKKQKVNKKTTYTVHWTAEWSTYKYKTFQDVLKAPGVPTVKIEKGELKAELNNLDADFKCIEFEIVKDNKTIYKHGKGYPKLGRVEYKCNIVNGSVYKVHCRNLLNKLYSDWSDYSENVGTPPNTPKGIKSIKSHTENGVYLDWHTVSNVSSYEIQYTTNKQYFKTTNDLTTITVTGSGEYIVNGLETGQEYFFRVRAVNDNGSSGWTEIKSIKLATVPTAPTTWSSSTVIQPLDPLTLYWVHNSTDGSDMTSSQLELKINNNKRTLTFTKDDFEQNDRGTIAYSLTDSGLIEELAPDNDQNGAKIEWKVRTKGVHNDYSPWSTSRTVILYAWISLEVNITNYITKYPFVINMNVSGGSLQKCINYSIDIVAKNDHVTYNEYGEEEHISAGQTIFSKMYNASSDTIKQSLKPNDVKFVNNEYYDVITKVVMNSGLYETWKEEDVLVGFEDLDIEPNAQFGMDENLACIFINPYCRELTEDEDTEGPLMSNILLSVYRIDFDGGFTEIATDISNNASEYVLDPHPSLSSPAYRIVAESQLTGEIGFINVIPEDSFEEKTVIIQWDETWSNIADTGDEEEDKMSWSGRMLKLPYNIDISEQAKPDTALIEYIGREHPVSYYGTQVGQSTTWNVVIPKEDTETLAALRKLSIWMGDVYVREPSGMGYWANITVSMSQTHKEVTIPVTLNITRVEGGK